MSRSIRMAAIVAVSSGAFAATPSAGCGPAIFRVAGWETNRNANVQLEDYKQFQTRRFGFYEDRLGRRFSSRFPSFSWLDIGSGYSVAALGAVASGLVEYAAAVNAQDALARLRARDHDWFRRHRGFDRTLEMSAFVRPSVRYAILDGRSRTRPNAIEIMVNLAADQLALYEGLGNFHFFAGLAEDVLPRLERRFQILTDLFGAYFYSARRPLLISEYYRRTAEDGQALVVIRGREKRVEPGRPPDEVTEFGPDNWIRRKDGREQRFEDYLVELYPTVFSTGFANPDLPHARTDEWLLIIQRDPRIPSLDALNGIEIESVTYGKTGKTAIQTPSVRYLER